MSHALAQCRGWLAKKLPGAEARASHSTSDAAREVARSANFLPAYNSASIDLLFNLARRGEVGTAEALEPDVAADGSSTADAALPDPAVSPQREAGS